MTSLVALACLIVFVFNVMRAQDWRRDWVVEAAVAFGFLVFYVVSTTIVSAMFF